VADESTKDPKHDQFGPAFLGILGLQFGTYRLRELVLAYNVELVDDWVGKAWVSAGGLTLCALFAIGSYRLVCGIILAVH